MEEQQTITGKAPWYASMTSQMGPVIVVMFVLLWLVVGPLKNNPSEHQEIIEGNRQIIEQEKIGNHFLWAYCVNQANIIDDSKQREEALKNCVVPLYKKPASIDDQAYIFEEPAKSFAVRYFPVALAESMHGSSSSAPVTGRRQAEENAERQRLEHQRAISGAVNVSGNFLSPSNP